MTAGSDTGVTRRGTSLPRVRMSFVLRLDNAELVAGRLVGDIEEVGSGRRQGVRDPRDVVDFCRASAAPSRESGVVPLGSPSRSVAVELE